MDKLLPLSIEAEQGVLGSLILDPEAIAEIIDMLSPEDFYRDAHRDIYRAIRRLYNNRQPADFITLCDELASRAKLEQVGGASYVTSLVNCVPTSGNIAHYAQIVQKKATCRRLVHAAGKIAATAYEEADNALELAEQLIYEVSEGTVSSDLVSLSTVIGRYIDRLDIGQRQYGRLAGISTGFDDLDFLLGRMQPSELIIVGGRPGTGKTSLALNIAYHAIFRQQCNIAIFSLEMSHDELARRLVSMQTGIDSQQLRTRRLQSEDWELVATAAGLLSDDHCYIDESGDLSIAFIRSKARRHKTKHGLDLIIVDYLQLMHADMEEKRENNRVQEIGKISRGLKQLAKELDVPVLALASLNRAVEGRGDARPRLSDLRESGSIESDADVVMFISIMKDTGSLVNIAKHRNGPVGDVYLRFDAKLTKFTSTSEPVEVI